jgi:hypothetical protein
MSCLMSIKDSARPQCYKSYHLPYRELATRNYPRPAYSAKDVRKRVWVVQILIAYATSGMPLASYYRLPCCPLHTLLSQGPA